MDPFTIDQYALSPKHRLSVGGCLKNHDYNIEMIALLKLLIIEDFAILVKQNAKNKEHKAHMS
jgi:hypothetical protein